jgi:hypothetical protein
MLINCKVAFGKLCKGKKYNWIQLAGHVGRFKPGEREGYILKQMDSLERDTIISIIANDKMAQFVPKLGNIITDNNDNKCNYSFLIQ